MWKAVVATALLSGAVSCAREQLRELLDLYTPHERYERVLVASGLHQTALGRDWMRAAEAALDRPVAIIAPYREESYFDPREAVAVAYELPLRRGQQVSVTFESGPDGAYQVFLDLFLVRDGAGAPPERVASADSTARTLAYAVRRDGVYLVRVQPELLRGGRYAASIIVGPTLAFPVHGRDTTAIRSRYGASRDAGRRRHEGLDIFAPRGTPVVAAGNGVIRSTRPNRLGGNVVWLRDDLGRSQYYAHLERHVVRQGQRVQVGDTIGFVGNSGNARTTPPHLHFGLYARGSFDPYPALYQPPDGPAAFTGDAAVIGQIVRATREQARVAGAPSSRSPATAEVARHTPLRVLAGSGAWYRVELPDGLRGFVAVAHTEPAAGPIRRATAIGDQDLLTDPLGTGVAVERVPAGTEVPVLGAFSGFWLVEGPTGRVGWMSAPAQEQTPLPLGHRSGEGQ
jgi:murein DD-endopeptidase MepM/ murein hydrolase activator NlpD